MFSVATKRHQVVSSGSLPAFVLIVHENLSIEKQSKKKIKRGGNTKKTSSVAIACLWEQRKRDRHERKATETSSATPRSVSISKKKKNANQIENL